MAVEWRTLPEWAKNLFYFVAIVVSLSAFSYFGVITLPPQLNPAAIMYGGTGGLTLSLQEVDVNARNPAICGGTCRLWAGTIVVNGKGESLVTGTLSKTSVAPSGSGVKARNDIPISYSLTQATCSYQTQNTLTQLWRTDPVPVNFLISFESCSYSIQGGTPYTENGPNNAGSSCWIKPNNNAFSEGYTDHCSSTGGYASYAYIGNIKKWWCYRLNEVAVYQIYHLITPSRLWSVNINFNNDVLTLDNLHQTKTSSDGNLMATYAYGGMTEQDCPSATSGSVLINAANEKKVSSIVTYGETRARPSISNGMMKTDFDKTISDFNAKATDYWNAAAPPSDFSGGQFSGMNYVLNRLSNPPSFPVIRFLAKADWMGIYIPYVKPVFVSSSACNFQSGQSGSLTVTVRNDGDDGPLEVYAICPGLTLNPNPFRTSSLAKGQTATATFTVSGSVGLQQCVITVQDPQDANNKAVGSASCQVTQACTLTAIPPWVVIGTGSDCRRVCGYNAQDCAPGTHLVATNTVCECQADAPQCNHNSICEANLGENSGNCGDCGVPPTTCVDGSAPNTCSSTNPGKFCNDKFKLVDDAQCVTPSPSPTVTPPPGGKCPLLNKKNALTGKCEADWVLIAIMTIIILAVAGGIAYGYTQGWFEDWF